MRILRNLVLIIVVISCFSSCRSLRKVYKAPLKEEGADYLFKKLNENELQFKYIKAKFNMHLKEGKKKTSFKGQIRIQKDSMIWVSFSPLLGIEVARMLITNDSVKFINRMNKTFFKGDYKYLNKFFDTNLDFNVLQALIIGNDFDHYEIAKFKASIDNMQYRLATAERNKLKKYIRKHEIRPNVFIQNIWLDPENFKISQISLKELGKENKKLQMNYNEFVEINSQLFPKNINFNLQADKKIDVKIDYSKIDVNEKVNFPFKVTKKYKSVSRLK